MKNILETPRLRLRQYTLEDAAFILELLNTKGWIKYIGDRNIKTLEQAKNYIKDIPLKSYQEHGYGLSMIELKEGNIPIGMCGIIMRDTLEHPDIGYALLTEFEGKGFAFEIVSATLDYAKNNLKIPVISAITNRDNKSSINILEKTGFKFVKEIVIKNDNEILLLFQV